ncbi:hypothetical protein B0F90DRAFT_1722916, partial [Multifurca ochricompacta]
MSGTHRRSHTPSFQGSVFSSSRFKEHLSISVPPSDPSIGRSHFSPHSPTGPSERALSLSVSTIDKPSPSSRPLDLEKGSTDNSSPRSTQPTIRDRFTCFFFDLQASRRESDSSVVQGVEPDVALQPKLSEWQPLTVRKQAPSVTQKLCSRPLLAALIVFLLYIFINVTIINVHVFAPARVLPNLSITTSPASAPTTTDVLSADTQQCIIQYVLNAPSDPTGYPCNTCLPRLATLSPNATAVYPTALDVTQFCGLRSIWEDANQQGQAGLEARGWVKDVKFCAWGGVRCDGTGRVSSLQLTFPAVPTSLPAEFTNLTALETLEVVGDGNFLVPGPFPVTFSALTKLVSLHLEDTALGALPDALQDITSLTLVRNAQIGSSLPPSIGNGNLRSLVVNNEALSLSAAQSTSLCGGQLKNCDLRGS